MINDNKQKNTFYEDYYEEFYLDFLQYTSVYYKKALQEPEKCIFIDSGVPSEMIMGLGYIPLMIELIPMLLPSNRASEDVMNTADRYFFNTGTCSFGRFALPAFEKKYIPLPKAFVTTTVCKDMSSNIVMLAKKYNVKCYCIDVPYNNNDDAIEYLSRQYKGMIDFFVDSFGIKPDSELIRKTLEYSSEALLYMEKALELRKSKPALLFGGPLLRFRNINFLRGSKKTLDILKKFYDLMEFRSSNNITPVKNQKVRILWNGSSPIYARDFFTFMEKKLGAVIVADPMCCVKYLNDFLEAEDPLKNMAKLMLDNPFGGNNSRILVEKAREYSVDGFIHFGQMNCNVINSKNWLIKNEMNKAGIPFLEMNGDLVDQRNSGMEQILTRVEAFIEMLEKMKQE